MKTITDSTTDYDIAAGLVDVLTDLLDATQAKSTLPLPLQLAHYELRRHASNREHVGRCDEDLLEALADITSETWREMSVQAS